jgi:hypothetical protein
MRLLLDDLMLLAAIDEQRPSEKGEVDLLGICADVIGDAHLRQQDRFISLEPLTGGPEDLLEAVTVVGDEPRLRQVVTNLVANALRYTPTSAQIAVRLGRSSGSGPPCLAQVGQVPTPPCAVVAVADTGSGIAPEHAEAVFERLVRLDPGRAHRGRRRRRFRAGPVDRGRHRHQSRRLRAPVHHSRRRRDVPGPAARELSPSRSRLRVLSSPLCLDRQYPHHPNTLSIGLLFGGGRRPGRNAFRRGRPLAEGDQRTCQSGAGHVSAAEVTELLE